MVVVAFVVLVVFGVVVRRVETGFFVVPAVLFFVDISVDDFSRPTSISSESDFFRAIGNLCGGPPLGGKGGCGCVGFRRRGGVRPTTTRVLI